MKNRPIRGLAAVATIGLAAVATMSVSAQASVVGTTSRSGYNDLATWPVGCTQPLASLSTISTLGVGVTATDATGSVDEDIQYSPGCSYDGWRGNFASGDGLVFTGAAFGTGSGPMTLSFSRAVAGAGVQIGSDGYGFFTADIDAYDGATLLGSFSEAGTENGNADGSAIFIGVNSLSGANITSIVVNADNPSGDFAINEVSLLTSIPEPATLTLLGVALAGLGFARRRRA